MDYKISLQDRKSFVKTIVNLTGIPPKFMGLPSKAYQIGPYQVTSDMHLIFQQDDKNILPVLMDRGLLERDGAASEAPQAAPLLRDPEYSEVQEESLKVDTGRPINVKLPLDQHDGSSIKRLIFYLYSYEDVLNMSTRGHFHVDDRFIPYLEDNVWGLTIQDIVILKERFEAKYQTPAYTGIEITNNKIIYSGFGSVRDMAESRAYETLAKKINEHCIKAKRMAAKKVKRAESDKYTVRLMLSRLDMGGNSLRPVRSLLMKDMKGKASFQDNDAYLKWKTTTYEQTKAKHGHVSKEEQWRHFDEAMERKRIAKIEAM